MARLALGRGREAEADASAAFRLDASPSHERLWTRTLLASGRLEGLRLDDPEELAALPAGGPALAADLRAAADRLRPAPGAGELSVVRILMARATILAAMGDGAAEAEAGRAITRAPLSAEPYLVRARVRRRLSDRRGALADLERALIIEPDAPRLLVYRGILRAETGHPDAALVDFQRAIRRGAGGNVRRPRAIALMALGRNKEAIDDWNAAAIYDPEDPRVYLGRARAFLRLGQWDQALADLERAAGWAGERAGLLARITLTYAACLPERPDRLPRVLALGRRTWSAWCKSPTWPGIRP
jgi:tetratricopeptide (TPR) repeat protein